MVSKKDVKIGVLAIQGDVQEHLDMMDEVLGSKGINNKTVLVKHPEQLENLHGLILPGGESTVMSRLGGKDQFNTEIFSVIKQKVAEGLALFGTCAGSILLASKTSDSVVENFEQETIGSMSIEVVRNKYGRQRYSFEVPLKIAALGKKPFPGVFIRAPVINKEGKGEVLCKLDGKILAVRENKCLAVTFHPELTDDTRIHEYFLKMILE